jgi:hypothetical protein
VFFLVIVAFQVILSYLAIKGMEYYEKSEFKAFKTKERTLVEEIKKALVKEKLVFEEKVMKKGYDRRRGHIMPVHTRLLLGYGLEIEVYRVSHGFFGTIVTLFPVVKERSYLVSRIKQMVDGVAHEIEKRKDLDARLPNPSPVPAPS